jgi:outer membrane immunogenic protein
MSWMSRLTLAAAAIGVATAAQAADLSYRKPAPLMTVPAFTWTGFYVGGQIGYTRGKDITKEFFTSPYFFVGLQNRFNPTGMTGGLHAGANLQFGSIVTGVEIDADFGNVKAGFVDPPVAPFNPGGRGQTELGLHGTVRGRLGYAFDRLLVYGTAGIAMGELKSTYSNWPGTTESFTRNITGYVVGAGAEYAVTDSITVRGEYRFTGYELLKNNSLIAFPGFTGTQEPRYHNIRMGLSYKF